MKTIRTLPDRGKALGADLFAAGVLDQLDRVEKSARQARCLSWHDDFTPADSWCRNGLCPRCGLIRAARRVFNLVRQLLRHLGRSFAFTLTALPMTADGDLDQHALRAAMQAFTRRMRHHTRLPGLEFVYNVQRNPAGTGYHLHAVGWSDRRLSVITLDSLTVMVSAAWGHQASAQQLGTGRYRHQTGAEAAFYAARYLLTDYRDDDKRQDSWDLNNEHYFHSTQGVDTSGESGVRGLFDMSYFSSEPPPSTWDALDDLMAGITSGGPEPTDDEWHAAFEARRAAAAAEAATAEAEDPSPLDLLEPVPNTSPDTLTADRRPAAPPPLDPELLALLDQCRALPRSSPEPSAAPEPPEPGESRQRRKLRTRRRNRLDGYHYTQGLPRPTERQYAAYDARLEAGRRPDTRPPRRRWDPMGDL